MYHNDLTRTGYLPNTPDPQHLTSAWQQPLDGKVYAEPLVVGGHVIVATENDTIYSLDAATGKIQWNTHVSNPEPQSQLPCGDINPLGITGTPVYDPATKLVFAVAEVEGATHTLFGLDIQTGAIDFFPNSGG
jgi:outer membrane protein assembly factor BamB